jgi:hypothetical protein
MGGALGNGSTNYLEIASVPVKVHGLDDINIVQISAGDFSSFALASDGSVYAWGQYYMERGGGPVISYDASTDLPIKFPALEGITISQISAGGDHCLALAQNGCVYAWGANDIGQLGNGGTTDSPYSVVQVQGLSNVKQVSAGGGIVNENSLALTVDGSVYQWGFAFGNDQRGSEYYSSPVIMQSLSNIAQVSSGEPNIALASDGSVYSWGSGALGDGTNNSDPVTPVQITGINLNTTTDDYSDAPFVMGQDNYSFENNFNSFGYSKPYRIPLSVYQSFFSNVDADWWNKNSNWNGNCYGLAASSAMFKWGGLIQSNFQSGIGKTHDFTNANSVKAHYINRDVSSHKR